MKIRIALYKQSETLFWRLIRWSQRRLPQRYSRYSHSEVVFMYEPELQSEYDKIENILFRDDIEKYGLSFSSSERDGGVRFKTIDWKKGNWDFVDIDVSRNRYIKMLQFARKQNGNKYNTIGILFAQIFNMNIKGNGTWFCSEITVRTLQEAWLLCTTSALFTNPWQLAEELEKSYTIIDF